MIYEIYFREAPYQTTQAIDKLYEGMELPIKTLNLRLNTEIIKQAHRIMMEDEEDVLAVGNRESRLRLQVIIFLHRPALLKDI